MKNSEIATVIKLFRIYLLFIVLLLRGNSLQAQFAEHYDARSFWGASSIYNVLPDRQGFLWFSTSNGLLRFDGSTLKRFDEHNGLPDNTVYKCFEDKEGRIWPFLGNGSLAYIREGRVFNKENDPHLRSFPPLETYITHMAQDEKGGYYITTHNRNLIYWQDKKLQIRRLRDQEGVEISPGHIRISADRDERFVKFFGKRKITCDKGAFKLYEQSKLIWILHDSVLAQSTTDICLTSDDKLVIATFKGTHLVDLKTKSRSVLLANVASAGCAVDFQGNIWICTTYDGVYRFHPALFSIRHTGVSDSGRWLETSTASLFLAKNGQLKRLNLSTDGVRLASISTRLSEHHVPLWIKGDTLAYFDPMKYEFSITKGRNILHQSRLLVKKVFAWSDTLVTVEAQSLGLWRPVGGKYRSFAQSAVLTEKRITASIADSIGACLYLIAGDQLLRFHLRNQKPECLIRDPALSGVREICLNKAQILIAAQSANILSFDTEQKMLRKYPVPERMTQLFPLPNNKLLMRGTGEDYLVDALDFAKAETIRYPFSLKNESLCSPGSGVLLCLGRDHVTAFNYQLLNQRQLPVKLYLQRLSVNGREYNRQSVDLGEQPSMNIQLSIGLLHFSNGAYPLRYRVCSASDTGVWMRMQGTDLAISLNKIAPYKIQVAPANELTNANSLHISLKAHPPFLKSRGFYALCLLIGIAILIIGIFWDIRRRKRRHSMELEYLKLEHRSINALLNPHFLFNAISNIQGLINKSEKHLATEYLAVLSRLMRQNLENLKENLIPLEDEITLIERYISLQNLRFSDRIRLQVTHKLSGAHYVLIPPLLIHTFVENAILHGFRPGGDSFSIELELLPIDEDYAHIIIRDNGIGYQASLFKKEKKAGKSLGISFNQKRLERISRIFGLQQSIRIRNLESEGRQGTQVDIILYRHLRKLQENWNTQS